MTTTSSLQWFKSSYSGGSGTECVEAALGDGITFVRDSKCPNEDSVSVRALAWTSFLHAVNNGTLASRTAGH